ncbi:TetR/AcrR family transcriptional regulator [Novosphingobium sp.]|uniref:TetR/AcrR family transcriptional regulator n=1 Tax=Novosphingobium sp. TaxID=1874826 RepID=UPI00286B2758|nr:TetR/AcrR family transcriptional regulator [Novosphingobium sp.]
MVTVSTSKAYHHGDLRTALVEAGLRHLEAGGETDISLRQLAREVGVSATAVYRHFPDKKALLAALAESGIARLGEAQRIASEHAGGGPAGFAATGRAYVHFALDNPALFRLTFTHAGHAGSPTNSSDEPSRLLRSYSEQFGGENAERLTLQAWAVAHGLAMLMLDGRLPPDDALINRVIDTKSLFPAQPSGSNNDASP